MSERKIISKLNVDHFCFRLIFPKALITVLLVPEAVVVNGGRTTLGWEYVIVGRRRGGITPRWSHFDFLFGSASAKRNGTILNTNQSHEDEYYVKNVVFQLKIWIFTIRSRFFHYTRNKFNFRPFLPFSFSLLHQFFLGFRQLIVVRRLVPFMRIEYVLNSYDDYAIMYEQTK